MNIEEYTNKISEKIGKDEVGKIADDIANILTYDSKLQKEIKDRDEEITKLKKDKEMLIEANGNLLQQVAFGKDETKQEVIDEPKQFDFKSVFDKNGFKR
jgi:hypothetical protein